MRAGVWWKLTLLLGPAVWFLLPWLLVWLGAALARSSSDLGVVLSVLGFMLVVAVYHLVWPIAPALLFVSWMLRSGRLAVYQWALWAALVGVVVGPFAEGGADGGAVCGIAYGLSFRACLSLVPKRLWLSPAKDSPDVA